MPADRLLSRGRRAAVARFAGAVLMLTGGLVAVDAAVTIAWQEPVTSLLAARAQAGLDAQLGAQRAIAARDSRTLTGVQGRRARVAVLARRAAGRARSGRVFGRIRLPTIDRDYAVVQGTDTASLRRGPGHYPDTAFPGAGGTVAVAGHRTTYLAPFRTIDRLDRGDRVVLDMPYARLTYRVERTRRVAPTDLSVLDEVGHEQLVLTACDPLYSAQRRIVVFAKLVDAVPVRPADG